MDEMTNSVSEVQDTNVSTTGSGVQESYQSQAAPAERLFKQPEVNDLIRRAKLDAVESYKRKADRSEYANYGSNAGVPQQQTDHFSQNQLNADDVRRMAVEESQRLRDEWLQDAHRKSQEQDAQRIVQEFFTKLSTGKDKYQDFDRVTDVDFKNFPNVVHLLNNFSDNLSDVMYELGKDRTKLATLESLCHISPRDAVAQVQMLSQSIKDNENSSKIRLAKEPLSQMRPSTTGTDNGAMSVSDYRRKYKG